MIKKILTISGLAIVATLGLLALSKPHQALAIDNTIQIKCTGGTVQVTKQNNDGVVSCSNPSAPFQIVSDTSYTQSINWVCSGDFINDTPQTNAVELSCPTNQGANAIQTVNVFDKATGQNTTWDLSGGQAIQNGTAAEPGPTLPAPSTATTNCNPNGSGLLFGLIKPWYAYLPQTDFQVNPITHDCNINLSFVNSSGGPNQSNINSVWLIGLAIFDDLLRIAGLVAVGFVIYGGIRYVTSQGEPENTKAAQSTIINALIGAAIAVIAAAAISFLGSKLGAG